MGASSSTQAVNLQDEVTLKLREELAEQEARAETNYEEMREYRSWLRQVEEGQETIQGSVQDRDQPDPVPDNPPGLWDQHDGSVVGKAPGEAQNEWVTGISRREHEKVAAKSRLRCQNLDVWRSFGNGPCSLCSFW